MTGCCIFLAVKSVAKAFGTLSTSNSNYVTIASLKPELDKVSTHIQYFKMPASGNHDDWRLLLSFC